MNLRSLPKTTTVATRRRGTLKALCVGALVVAALVVVLASYALAATSAFPDVPTSHPFHTAIVELADRGIVGGYTDGRFGPSDSVMRQQFAKMLTLTGGYAVSESDVCPFADVEIGGPSTLYPDNYVAVAAREGLTVGKTPTAFDPYALVTRYQVVSMVVRMVDDLRPGLLAAPPAGWAGAAAWQGDAVHGANAARAGYGGLLAGLDLASISPYAAMARGEAAQVLYNALTKLAAASTTTTTASTSTTGLTTTTTAAPTTTTTVAATTTTLAATTTTTAFAILPSSPSASDYSIAGLEPAQVVVTVQDQFGNPMPLVMVTLNSKRLEGSLTNLMTSMVIGPTDANGNVAYSWTQATGNWGVEEVTASVGAYSSKVSLIQWIYDDRVANYVSASPGQSKVTIAPGYAPWNGDQLKVFRFLSGGVIGTGTYVAAAGLVMTTGHVWAPGDTFFVGATSTNTDEEPNWMYGKVPTI
jgi:hypothetical protein